MLWMTGVQSHIEASSIASDRWRSVNASIGVSSAHAQVRSLW